jgi:hypothetical protein
MDESGVSWSLYDLTCAMKTARIIMDLHDGILVNPYQSIRPL